MIDPCTLPQYTTDMMEAYPDALVVPTVLFTDRKKWRKTVPLDRLGTSPYLQQPMETIYPFCTTPCRNTGMPRNRKVSDTLILNPANNDNKAGLTRC